MSNKNSYYFPHDYNARSDPKLQKIMAEIGHEGKSVFWDLVEMMYEQGGKLPLDGINGYAFVLHTNSECITKLISIAFKTDKTYFWSQSVLDRLAIREEKSQKARESVLRRWNKKDTNVLRSQYDSNTNKGKERKIKEIKEVSIKSKYPTFESIETNSKLHEELSQKYNVPISFVLHEIEIMKNWLEKFGKPGTWGKPYRNYKAGLRDFILRDAVKIRKEANGKSTIGFVTTD